MRFGGVGGYLEPTHMGVEESSNVSHQGPSPKDPWALTRLATSLDSCKPRSETSNKISTGDTRELVYLFNKYVRS